MPTQQVLIEKNVPCTLRDGTVLRADVYRPNDDGRYPVLLTRLPYNKDLPRYSQMVLDPIRAANCGYIVVVQDVRGRFHSEGEFRSFAGEAEDGYDAVEWAAQLPGSSGKVGMYGLSYFGFTQWLAAKKRPPHLHAIFPMMTLNDLRTGSLYHGGAFELGLMVSWTLGNIVPDLLLKKYGKTPQLLQAMKKYAHYVNRFSELFWDTRFVDWDVLKDLGVGDFFFSQFRHAPDDEAFWEKTSLLHAYEQIDVPAYHLAGWYDCFLGPTLDNYTHMRQKAPENARAAQKLIIGPWSHGQFSSVVGERAFGVHAAGDWINFEKDLTSLQLEWFDQWLKGTGGKEEEAPVKLFVMGENVWREESEWPLKRTRYTPLYLHSNGKANTQSGDGTLSFEKPEAEEADHFTYDPNDPVPTTGGATLYAGVLTAGPRDQREVERRPDVLVYTSEALTEPLEVTGPVEVKLWAKSDAPDTDFTAKLIDVFPDGTAFLLTDGIIRAKYRNGFQAEPPLNGEIIAYTIDLWATGNVFLPGHRIRLEISSSNFPRFDRNPNTGRTLIEDDKVQVAHQTVYHDRLRPSHIVLPVIPR